MAPSEPALTVVLSPTAIDELFGIWHWNAERYSPAHADSYLRYLKTRIDDLASLHAQGKLVTGRPDLRYLIIRRKTRGHGHVAVYRVDGKQVHVLHVFHTAQAWQADIAREKPSQ